MKMISSKKPKRKTWRINSTNRPEDLGQSAFEYYESGLGRAHVETGAVRRVQRELALRALMHAQIPLNEKVLDAGCGSGFSLEVLKEAGYKPEGFDISPALVALSAKKGFKAKEGDLRKIPFSDGSFGAMISISAIQWLLQGSEIEKRENMKKCAKEFFRVLKPSGKAAIQFYPKTEGDLMLAGTAFKNAGLKTTIITENENNPKKRRFFLVLEKSLV